MRNLTAGIVAGVFLCAASAYAQNQQTPSKARAGTAEIPYDAINFTAKMPQGRSLHHERRATCSGLVFANDRPYAISNTQTRRRMGPGGLPGLQNRVGGRKVAGGFDSLPPPPSQSQNCVDLRIDKLPTKWRILWRTDGHNTEMGRGNFGGVAVVGHFGEEVGRPF